MAEGYAPEPIEWRPLTKVEKRNIVIFFLFHSCLVLLVLLYWAVSIIVGYTVLETVELDEPTHVEVVWQSVPE